MTISLIIIVIKASVNGKKYILIIVDDYSRFTWVKFLRSKDEALDFIIKFLKMIQLRLKVPVRRNKTDNGTGFVNQTLREYYEKVGISHKTSVARSPQQNGVIERRNRTIIEAARTMLIYVKASLFLWAEVVATACYTQNRSIIRLRYGKTPYELLHDKLLDLSFFHVFDVLCYPTNDSENLGKLQPKANIDFDELTVMASEHNSSGPALHEMTPTTISSGLMPNPPPSTSVDHPALGVVAPIDEVATPEPAVSTGSPSSTIVDQDAPSPSISQTALDTQPPVIPNDVEEDNHDIKVAHMGNDPYFGIPIPETYKDALNQACWIEAMQEELNEFEQLEVWELVPQPDKVMVFTLKWIYKVKLDELGDKPNHVYMLKKALYGLKQAPRAWYDMLSSFLISQDFSKGSVDPTLFIRRDGKELLLKSKLDEDKEGKAVDPSHYRGMIGTLLYLTASRPDLQFAICMCARYQARPTKKHLNAVKMIFRYLKGTVNQGLWYLKDSSIALTAFADADHAGCQDTRRSTSGSMQFLGDRLISWSSKRQKSAAISSTEAKLYCLSGSCAQIPVMRSPLTDYELLFQQNSNDTGITQSAIA
ncbi:retrovirus-related pol polyprotein from transposon TNT 1-94 [Tanacetum coccineum]|uniref:Retrovirus-related pol polyprotein from transposon TNT 1-94 n=1 Tax=Tanacetum coccineum TaxID=301880 RepID=A0ABQ5FZJ3_9ASTR